HVNEHINAWQRVLCWDSDQSSRAMAEQAFGLGCLAGGFGLEELLLCRQACRALKEASRAPLLASLELRAGAQSSARCRAGTMRLLACVAPEQSPRLATYAAGQLRDPQAEVRLGACALLAASGAGLVDFAARALGPALADRDERVSQAALKALVRLVPSGNEAATELARRQLGSQRPWVRRSALAALAHLAPPPADSSAVAQVCALLSDEDWQVRLAAARALPRLARRGDAAASCALEAALRDKDPTVRRVAAGALVHVASWPSAPFLALKAQDLPVSTFSMCLCLLGIALALLVQPSTDFARGVPGLKDSILAKRHPLHAGVARRAGAAQEDNSGQDRRDLEEVVAEADRVLEDNGTVKETKAVLRKAQKIYPGKWTLSGKKDELQQKLREFVEEAKATKKGLEEDSHRAQVTSWHPGRGGVASRASPQQDSGAEDWLAKSREEVEAFGEEEVLSWSEAVLNEGKVRDELIQRTVTTLQQQGVTGKSLLELTLEQMMQDGILRGPAVLLTKKIQLLQEPQVELPRFNAADLSDLEDRFLNRRINNKNERPFEEREAVVESVVEQMEEIQRKQTNKPTVLALYSPRGTGKTSLIRHLAKVSNFSESRRCGRLLVLMRKKLQSYRRRKMPFGLLLPSSCGTCHSCCTGTALK
ncbi:unnamed protein product, partial [Effrenium voratum]